MRSYRSTIAGGLVALALVAGCSEDEAAAGAGDQGTAADGQVMADAATTPDGAAPDAMAPDAAVMPPAETVTLTLANLLDADGVGALAGVSVCVLEYRAVLPCAAVEGEPAGAAVTVPKGEPFHIVFDSPD